jgi:hypothetical protein
VRLGLKFSLLLSFGFDFFNLEFQFFDDHEVMTMVVEDYTKKVLDQGQTSAEFGIVSLSGTC